LNALWNPCLTLTLNYEDSDEHHWLQLQVKAKLIHHWQMILWDLSLSNQIAVSSILKEEISTCWIHLTQI
jgi:hypothetical protein